MSWVLPSTCHALGMVSIDLCLVSVDCSTACYIFSIIEYYRRLSKWRKTTTQIKLGNAVIGNVHSEEKGCNK